MTGAWPYMNAIGSDTLPDRLSWQDAARTDG